MLERKLKKRTLNLADEQNQYFIEYKQNGLQNELKLKEKNYPNVHNSGFGKRSSQYTDGISSPCWFPSVKKSLNPSCSLLQALSLAIFPPTCPSNISHVNYYTKMISLLLLLLLLCIAWQHDSPLIDPSFFKISL